jgi:hypothetical protein
MRRLALLMAVTAATAAAQRLKDFDTPRPLPRGDTLVIGFLGGWERWNDPRRGVRQTALALRTIPRMHAETIGNHNRKRALQLIREGFDFNGNGRLDPHEARDARLVLYGQSMGGGAAVLTARDLRKLGVPVLLTVQVDSVGRRDAVIPDNVAAAANFFQRESWPLVGQKTIRAEDPRKTRILGNYQYSYKDAKAFFPAEPWRALGGSHAKMEQDPELWGRVMELIVQAASR